MGTQHKIPGLAGNRDAWGQSQSGGAPIRRGARFRVEVPAGDKAKIELGYRITLPGKNELVGGNR